MQASAEKTIQKINYNFLGVFLKIIGKTIAEIKFGTVAKAIKNPAYPVVKPYYFSIIGIKGVIVNDTLNMYIIPAI